MHTKEFELAAIYEKGLWTPELVIYKYEPLFKQRFRPS